MKMNQDERRFDFHGLGLALKQAREEKGWTQAYVAERCIRARVSEVRSSSSERRRGTSFYGWRG